jgi:CheY-like chemotaxis protein
MVETTPRGRTDSPPPRVPDRPTGTVIHPIVEHRLRILLAEDNPVNQKVVSMMLEQNGHEVTVVDNGKQAVEAFQTGSFNLVFMDIQMPEMDGFEALASIRLLEPTRGAHTPIIALTAHAMKGDEDLCRDAGFDGYLPKPVRRAELDAAVVAAQTRPMKKAGPLAIGQFNRSFALEQAGGDEGLLRELIELFLNCAPEQLECVRKAVERGDGQVAERSAHALKGSVSHFLAPEAMTPLHELEKLSKAGRIGEAKERFNTVQTMLGDLFSEMSKAACAPV